jgi:hypothetical protein
MFRMPKRRATDMEQTSLAEIDLPGSPRRKVVKRLVICTAVLGLGFSNAAQAKGCIKGAIVGGVAGHLAGHGKLGAAAGCAIGHHEANKPDAQNNGSQPAAPPK